MILIASSHWILFSSNRVGFSSFQSFGFSTNSKRNQSRWQWWSIFSVFNQLTDWFSSNSIRFWSFISTDVDFIGQFYSLFSWIINWRVSIWWKWISKLNHIHCRPLSFDYINHRRYAHWFCLRLSGYIAIIDDWLSFFILIVLTFEIKKSYSVNSWQRFHGNRKSVWRSKSLEYINNRLSITRSTKDNYSSQYSTESK